MVFLESFCNTTDAELRMYSDLASYTSPLPHPLSPPHSMLLSESIEKSPSFGKGVFGKLASFQCSLSALCNKSHVHSTFLPDISAEIHLAVRKQLLFIKGRGRRNFNFKDVLNELPRCDGLALRNLPPAPPYASAGGFNYSPPELLLLAPQWYASCMWVEWIFPHLVARSALYHCTQCHLLKKMHCHQSECCGIEAFIIHVFTCLLTLTHPLSESDLDWWTILFKLTYY